jgi:hypothetical protein
MRAILRTSITTISLLLGVTTVSALEQKFERPRYRDNKARLDACYTFGTNCGKFVADKYCVLKGFHRANSFETERARPTQTYSGGQTCNGSFCVSFKNIVCFTRNPGPDPAQGWPVRIDPGAALDHGPARSAKFANR